MDDAAGGDQDRGLVMAEEPVRRDGSPVTDPTGHRTPDDRTERAPGADRRTGRSASPSGVERRSGIEMTPGQLARRQIPRLGEGPVASTIAICVCALLAITLLGIGFSRPSTRTVPLAGAFRQTGTFSYSAPVIAPTPVYPSGVVTTGQPIYPSLVNTVAMTFRYAFASSLPHSVHGTVEFRALLLSQTDTWQEVSTIHPTSTFSGDTTSITSQLALPDLYSYINSVSQQSAVAATTYSADLQPVVHLAGVVDGRRIDETFQPVLPFAVTQNVITLAVAAAVAPPGATYSVPSASAQRASTLSPVQVGSIPHQVDNVATVAKFQIRVPVARVLGIIFGVLAVIVLGVDEYFRRRSTRRSDEELLAAKMHVLVVPVSSLGEPSQRTAIDIDRFSHLARLAQFLERPILYQMAGGQRTYAVDDEFRQYQFRPADDVAADRDDPENSHRDPAPRSDAPSMEVPRADATRTDTARTSHAPTERSPSTPRVRPTWRSIVARGTAAVVIVALSATLITSFTASTNVPVSSAGTSVQLRLVSQLAPAGCGSLNLTRLVTGSGVITNGLANALLLGSAGADTITDTGGNSCIVPGGGAGRVTGVPTDICISGPTLNLAAPCPVPNPSNGVVVVPSSDNYNNYGGQERLSITSSKAITAMTVTIKVAQTPGITINGQANSFPGGSLTQSSGAGGGVITFSYVLATGASIPANYPNGVVYAQYSGTGSPHPSSGDTWTVVSTAGGTTSTLTGTF